MDGDDHVTRTLLLSRQAPGILLVSHGSGSNLDPVSLNVSSGHAQIRAFSLPNVSDTGYDYSSQGRRVGWGLRNSVGMAEHPITAGLYSVENSADQLQREGKDISNDNPGEELNYHGLVNSSEEGGNHGYPTCFTSWVPEDLPDEGNLTIGAQFVIGTPNSTINDDYCARERIPPRLAFQAHMAPLDIKFNNTGTEAWISFHGSW
jgi:glucose/arabinose dehydrogenase